MFPEILNLFSQLSPAQQRDCLRELSDSYDISINFDLVTELKMKIKNLEVNQGMLKSYAEELENDKKVLLKDLEQISKKKMTWREMFATIPKDERKEIKKNVQTALFYRNLSAENKKLRARIKELQADKYHLIAANIKLKGANSK